MNVVRHPSLRAVICFAMVIAALLAFAAAKITTVNGVAGGEDPDLNVAASANPDTPGFAAATPGQLAVEMRQKPTLDDRELGAWLLMIFGLGAVAFALRCRRSDRVRYQFA
jgi:hypothetical protein